VRKSSVALSALLVGGVIAMNPANTTLFAADTIPLAGEWRFALDRNDAGTNEQWFARNLPDKIQLPGALEAQGYGDEIGIHAPWVLTLYDHFWYLRADYAAYTNAGSVKVPFLCQPPRHYLGAAWYQRDIEIPADWSGKRVVLFLERPHWKSTIWLDDREIGSDVSLCTPHEYDFGIVPPGQHHLTIRVDNRMILPYRPDAHSVSDSLDDAWNGIVGKIELQVLDEVCIERLRLAPDLGRKGVAVTLFTYNGTGQAVAASLVMLQGVPQNFGGNALKPIQQSAVIESGETNLTLFFPMGARFEHWSEFNPKVYNLRATIGGKGFHSEIAGTFGMREFKADGNQFILNGHPIYFRGTHFGGDFPLTGYPPTDVESWKKIFQTCKDWGLNHMRFHSWCPPEAAFEAADELGFYLQVECGMWNEFTPGGEMEKMLYSETDRILRDFGNHPSLMLISASNEAHGRWQPVLTKWVEHFRADDPRHLYTPDTGWSLIDSPGQPLNGGADYLAIGRIGPNHVRGESGWFGRDYRDSIAGVNVPVIAHEVGQWCAYPDFDVIKKFTGFMQPGNFEIFRDSAAAHGLFATNDNHEPSEAGRAGNPLPAARSNAVDGAHGVTRPTNKDFAWASGRFQLECYKEEIEANLRTPGLDGFQLLDLHDYTGQGTALVGLLDPFWEGKGYATPDEFKEFCNATVPLARLTRRTFTTADKFEVPVEVAHFGETPLEVAVAGWQIVNLANEVVARGEFAVTNIPIGKNFPLGNVLADLSRLPAPAQYDLSVVIGQASHIPAGRFGVLPPFINNWNFWLYPAQVSETTPPDVFVTSSWDDAEKKLSAGGKVLFLPRNTDLDWTSPPLARVPVFWNALMGPTWSRMLGLWCETNSPALAEFPTEPNCDWQWTELLRDKRAVNLDRLPKDLQPMVSAIDDWNRNCKLGLIFEAKIGPGKLLVCSIDLSGNLSPVAQQLRRSLLDYMAGEKFQPQTEISLADFESLHFDTRIMRQLGATAEADGRNANAIIDGDPNTFWSSADARGNGPKYPHALTVHFPQPVAMDGLMLMPRQNQREHQGDIHDYTIQVSDDGNQWREIERGQLASTWNPQPIHFSQTITAKHLKLTALSGFGTDHSTALAELAVIYAGPKLADDNSATIEYQRVRTASPDIDASTDVSNKPPNTSP
jgi:beta-galactosidase